jgi:hypothetical protein
VLISLTKPVSLLLKKVKKATKRQFHDVICHNDFRVMLLNQENLAKRPNVG